MLLLLKSLETIHYKNKLLVNVKFKNKSDFKVNIGNRLFTTNKNGMETHR